MSYVKASLLSSSIQVSLMVTMLVRNIIFARLLSPDDFTIAMTFGIVLLFFEFVSNFGYENLMQRSKNGNEIGFQSTIHSTLIVKGVVVAFFIVVSAPYISRLLDVPQDTFNFAYLAIIPLLKSLMHTDHMRLHREHQYYDSARISILSDISSIAVALACAWLWNSYWGFFISFIYRQSIGAFLSHVWAERPYRLGLNKAYLLELWVFGLPILFIGLLRYLSRESDKVLVTHFTGLDNLASYFLTVMVITGVLNLITISLSKIFIRRISVQNNKDQQAERAIENGTILLYVSLPVVATLILGGEVLIALLFGPTYQPIIYLAPILSILICIRSMGTWLTQIIIASDKTSKVLIADVAGISGLVLAMLSAYYFSNILLITAAYCVGELIAFLVLCYQLNRSIMNFYQTCLKLLATSLSVAVSVSLIYMLLIHAGSVTKVIVGVISSIIIILLFNLFSKTCRKQTVESLRFMTTIFNKKARGSVD